MCDVPEANDHMVVVIRKPVWQTPLKCIPSEFDKSERQLIWAVKHVEVRDGRMISAPFRNVTLD